MHRYYRNLRDYALFVGLPVLGILLVLWLGPSHAESGLLAPPAHAAGPGAAVAMPNVPRLLMQVLVIVGLSAGVGRLLQSIGQPRVVGEMIAGIALGPSALGILAPKITAAIFPPASLGFLSALSQIGLVFFMFLIGLELDTRLLRGRGHTAILTSHASITAPFLLGTLVAIPLHERLGAPGVGFLPFALFMGAAMSMTAFPVLARILRERRLLETRVGAIAIVCAAIDDVTAWCILAIVVLAARAGGSGLPFAVTVGGTLAYCALMVWAVRPLLARLGRRVAASSTLTPGVIAVVAMVVLGSAWTTDVLGVHALFGAFLAGTIMPRNEAFVRGILQRFEDVMVIVLLPLFFAFTGLRTRIGLIHGLELWAICALITLVAIAGKFGGSLAAARRTGMPWREAGAVGILMNTRGLMELVILNVGLDIGVLSPTLFAMMVIMALVTTFMTTPILAWMSPSASRPLHAPMPFTSRPSWKTGRR